MLVAWVAVNTPTASLKMVKTTIMRVLNFDKLSVGEASVLKVWGMWNTLSLLPGPLSPGLVVPVEVLSKDQTKLFNHLIVCKQMADVNL